MLRNSITIRGHTLIKKGLELYNTNTKYNVKPFFLNDRKLCLKGQTGYVR